MSANDLHKNSLDHKIVAGLERISLVYRTLLWEEAKKFGLSPIQIQILIFTDSHVRPATVSYLSEEFNVTKPTISDAVKSLLEKELVSKVVDKIDTRSYKIVLTKAGKKLVRQTENYTAPLVGIVEKISPDSKTHLWQNISSLIKELNIAGLVSAQRSCFSCSYFRDDNGVHFCNLIGEKLAATDIKIDCEEFESIAPR